MKRYCFTCDLENDPELIAKYKEYHKKGNVWKEILQSIRESGIVNMEIYVIATRMFMILEAEDRFSLDKKEQMDAMNVKVQEWENLMTTFQKIPSFSECKQKWVLMNKFFDFSEHY